MDGLSAAPVMNPNNYPQTNLKSNGFFNNNSACQFNSPETTWIHQNNPLAR